MLAAERKALREAFHNVVESLSALYIFREALPNSEKGKGERSNSWGPYGPQESPEPLSLYINPNGKWRIASEASRMPLKRFRAFDLLRKPKEIHSKKSTEKALETTLGIRFASRASQEDRIDPFG